MVSSTNEPLITREQRPPEVSPVYPTVNANDPKVIRAQIEQTRAQMEGTLDEIQVRLSPDYIIKQTQNTLREATLEKVEKMTRTAEHTVNNWRSNAVHTVKENPIPAALIGVGIGWLLLSSNKEHNGEYSTGYSDYERPYDRDAYGEGRQGRSSYEGDRYPGDRYQDFSQTGRPGPVESAQRWVGETAEQAQHKTEDAAAALRENVGEVTAQAQEFVSETTEQAREKAMQARIQAQQTAERMQMQAQQQAYRVKRTFWNTLQENPLLIGAGAGIAGALLGLALPITEKEKELMGETRDHLVEEASSTIQETARKAQVVAERTAQTAATVAKEEAEKQDLPMPSATTPTKHPTTSTEGVQKTNVPPPSPSQTNVSSSQQTKLTD